MPKLSDRELYEVEAVLAKKIYKNRVYYKLKWVGYEEPTWELEKNCSCSNLIEQFESEQEATQSSFEDEEDDEWEVEEILKKRVRNNENEYLLKWKNWPGEPNWVKESDCDCINLIAAFENPKLRKMWNFDGTNPRLWLDQEAMLCYMRRHAHKRGYRINLLEFEPDLPANERPAKIEEGINIGPLLYKNHWYLIIVLVNHICITKKLMISDPLNTLIGVPNVKVHPVFKRMTNTFKNIPVRPIAMTPMDRSDMCAFYVLAGYERALFIFQDCAKFVATKLFYDHARPELIRQRISRETDGEISVSLPTSGSFLDGPQCEFCGTYYDSCRQVDEHIMKTHFRDVEMDSPIMEKRRHSSTGHIPKERKRLKPLRASN